uniref:G_PROTEIN_RECEP_F1_2 domain-containing protein n=1 Tax=Heterorhabditis bacteriophora TaxID=37862 RepID=A0A1I7XMF4_HETBA
MDTDLCQTVLIHLPNQSVVYDWSRRQMRTPVNMILTAMACCDTVVLFSNLIYTTHYSFVAFKYCHPRHWSYSWALFLIAHAHISLVGHSSSVWLSGERNADQC